MDNLVKNNWGPDKSVHNPLVHRVPYKMMTTASEDGTAEAKLKIKSQTLNGLIFLATAFALFAFLTPGWIVEYSVYSSTGYNYNNYVTGTTVVTSFLMSIAIISGVSHLVMTYIKSLRDDFSVRFFLLTSVVMTVCLSAVAILLFFSFGKGGSFGDGIHYPGYSYLFACVAALLSIVSSYGAIRF